VTDWESGLGSGGMAVGGSGGAMDMLGSHVVSVMHIEYCSLLTLPLQPFSLDYFQTTVTLMDILVEMYHKLTMFLVMGREGTVKEGDMALEVQPSTVAVATMDTMNKIDVKVKVSASL
jgi:hypothetical protein